MDPSVDHPTEKWGVKVPSRSSHAFDLTCETSIRQRTKLIVNVPVVQWPFKTLQVIIPYCVS